MVLDKRRFGGRLAVAALGVDEEPYGIESVHKTRSGCQAQAR